MMMTAEEYETKSQGEFEAAYRAELAKIKERGTVFPEPISAKYPKGQDDATRQ